MYDATPIELFKITSGLTDVDYKIVDTNLDLNQEYAYTGFNILDRFNQLTFDKSFYDSSHFAFLIMGILVNLQN